MGDARCTHLLCCRNNSRSNQRIQFFRWSIRFRRMVLDCSKCSTGFSWFFSLTYFHIFDFDPHHVPFFCTRSSFSSQRTSPRDFLFSASANACIFNRLSRVFIFASGHNFGTSVACPSLHFECNICKFSQMCALHSLSLPPLFALSSFSLCRQQICPSSSHNSNSP